MALLIASYSAVAISKSCSSCVVDPLRRGSSPYIQANSRTLNRFFSSLNVFSFLSRSLVRVLLNRS